jgi:hypothetical protein
MIGGEKGGFDCPTPADRNYRYLVGNGNINRAEQVSQDLPTALPDAQKALIGPTAWNAR